MVGDSLKADVCGALAVGMRAVLLRRSGETPADLPAGVPVIRTLAELEPCCDHEEHEKGNHEAREVAYIKCFASFVIPARVLRG